jgi:hypothetical protein
MPIEELAIARSLQTIATLTTVDAASAFASFEKLKKFVWARICSFYLWRVAHLGYMLDLYTGSRLTVLLSTDSLRQAPKQRRSIEAIDDNNQFERSQSGPKPKEWKESIAARHWLR